MVLEHRRCLVNIPYIWNGYIIYSILMQYKKGERIWLQERRSCFEGDLWYNYRFIVSEKAEAHDSEKREFNTERPSAQEREGRGGEESRTPG